MTREKLLAWAALAGGAWALWQGRRVLEQRRTDLQRGLVDRADELSRADALFQQEVADRRRAEASLEASEAKYRLVFDHSPDAFLILDSNSVFVDCNPAAERMLRGDRDRIVGQQPWTLSPATQPGGRTSRASAQRILAAAPRFANTSFEWVHRRFDGSDVVVDVSMAPIQWDGEPSWFITWRDATERKRLHAELHEQATTDSLTGVLNRHRFMQIATREIRRAQRLGSPLAMAVLDLDHFKRINDTYGHAVGDQVLQAVTTTCCQAIREIDVFGRLGGDEFVLLLPETGGEQAVTLLERLRAKLALTPIGVEGDSVEVTVSAGVATWDGAGDYLDALIDRADRAMYRAKESGRNRVVLAGAV